MGLDGAELVMEVEDVFDISIDEDEPVLDADGTAGDLYRYVLGKLREKGMLQETSVAARCLSSVAFYVFRRGLVEEFGLDRRSVRPSSRIADLVPLEGRRRRWKALAKRLDLGLPRLELSGGVAWAIGIMALAFTVAGLALPLLWAQVPRDMWTVGWFAGIIFAIVAVLATRPLAVHFSSSCETVRGVVLKIMVANLARVRAAPPREGDEPRLHAEHVWEILRAAICEALDVSPDQVTKGTRFVKDLGVG